MTSHRPPRRRWRLRTVQVLVLALLSGGLLGVGDRPKASAAIAADFDAGYIISDSAFFNPATMSDSQVQGFLDAKGSACTAGEQPCLKNYTMTTVAKTADGICQGYTGGIVQSAAQIIGGVARSCGINPQVLLVLLEKEQRLITRTAPTTTQYTKAVGYACPDGVPCNPAYAGLFLQLYSAAHRFEEYATNPSGFNYKAGKVNSILWNVATSGCGAGDVYIRNQATAGLYNYTPYQPNSAAMANLYGTGDACSAYGNRNFWRMFTDWFGNPQAGGGFLMRTAENGTVYVVSGTSKYPIADMATLSALSPLGSVGYVSQQYLDRRTTVSMMSRIVLAADGTVYFIDAGIKLPFMSCGMVADYGGDCGNLVRLDQSLIDLFTAGPPITPIYRTTSGKAFFVSLGTKREVADDLSLTQAGLPTSSVTLLETGLGNLPYGLPVTRDGVLLQNRSTGVLTVSAGGFTTVSPAVATVSPLRGAPVRSLDDASMRLLPATAAPGALLQQAGTSSVYLVTEQGKKLVTDPGMLPPSPPQVPAALLAMLPDAGTLDAGTFLKGSGSASIYAFTGGKRRGIAAWADLVALSGGNTSPPFFTFDQRLVDQLPLGPLQLGPAALVVSNRSATVYFVNGRTELIPVTSFLVTDTLGANWLRRVADSDIDAYTIRPGVIGTAVTCGGVSYLGLGFSVYTVGADVASQYNLSFVTMDPTTCAALPKGGNLTRFLRAANGTIFYIENGAKRPIASMQAFLDLGGASKMIQASDYALSLIPTGPLLSAASQAAQATTAQSSAAAARTAPATTAPTTTAPTTTAPTTTTPETTAPATAEPTP